MRVNIVYHKVLVIILIITTTNGVYFFRIIATIWKQILCLSEKRCYFWLSLTLAIISLNEVVKLRTIICLLNVPHLGKKNENNISLGDRLNCLRWETRELRLNPWKNAIINVNILASVLRHPSNVPVNWKNMFKHNIEKQYNSNKASFSDMKLFEFVCSNTNDVFYLRSQHPNVKVNDRNIH